MTNDEQQDRHRSLTRTVVAVAATVFMPFIVLWRALRGIWNDPASRGILVTAGVLLLAGTFIFMLLEDYSLLDSFYFSFITLATIGYGDFSPVTDAGKIATVVYSFAGLGIMAALISTIASQGRALRRQHQLEEADDAG